MKFFKMFVFAILASLSANSFAGDSMSVNFYKIDKDGKKSPISFFAGEALSDGATNESFLSDMRDLKVITSQKCNKIKCYPQESTHKLGFEMTYSAMKRSGNVHIRGNANYSFVTALEDIYVKNSSNSSEVKIQRLNTRSISQSFNWNFKIGEIFKQELINYECSNNKDCDRYFVSIEVRS